MTERARLFDFSGGPQSATSWLLRKSNEIENSRNARFGTEIGSMIGRPGVTQYGDPFSSVGKPALGGITAQFREGAKRLVAVENDAGTATKVRTQDTSTGAWTDVIADLPADATVYFTYYLNEIYVSGHGPDGTPFQPRNINSSLNVSTTRNLLNCPYPHYFIEFKGVLYAANVLIGSTRYPDRVYKASGPTSAVTFVKGDQSSATMTSMALGSVRYLKAGMAIDVYAKNGGAKLYDLTITAVDKTTNTISFASTNITVTNNDEIYLDGRHGLLNTLWNTDYPTDDRADFLAVIPGTDSSNEITGVARGGNRLHILTENSISRYDGANLIPYNNNVGCISHNSIANIDNDWMVWLDGNGQVWARQEASGSQDIISRGIYNNILSHFTPDELRSASAVAFNGQYKLYIGTLDGQYTRIVYDFNTNTWSPEALGVQPAHMIVDIHNTEQKPIILGADGKLYIDELGDDDDGQEIYFMAELGRTNFGTEGKKQFEGLFIYSENAKGLSVMAASGTGQMKQQGRITEDEGAIKFINTGRDSIGEASTINLRIQGRYRGGPPVIEGIVPYFNSREDVPRYG